MKTLTLILISVLLPLYPTFASDLSWQDFLKQIVEINTGTQNLAGLKKLKTLLITEFKSLGFEYTEIANKNGRSVLTFQIKDARPTIGFYAHLDTVFKEDSPFQKFAQDANGIHGPGVIDMKGGIALMREVLRTLKTENPKNLEKIKLLFNDDEEIGSPDSKVVLNNESKGLTSGFIFEPGTEMGELVLSQSGIQWIELTLHGKAAHAGLEFDKGKNACLELAKLLPELAAQTRLKNHFTVNVGVLSGGTTANIVCEEAKVKFDIRYVRPTDLEQFLKLLRKRTEHLPTGYSASIQTPVDIKSLGAEKTKVLIDEFKSIAKRLNQPLSTVHVGYVADSNHLQDVEGLNLLIGIGPYGSGMHADRETMAIESFEARTKLLLDWLRAHL